MSNRIFPQLSRFGFTAVNDNVCVGTWDDYAVQLQGYAGKTYYVYVAIRIPKESSALKKAMNAAFKAAGVRRTSIVRAAPNYLCATLTFGRSGEEDFDFQAFMNTLTAALRQNGVGPADTCAITGASNPDSLCLVGGSKYLGYQPVSSAAIRQRESDLRSKVEDNEANGSYIIGLIGAILGMLLAVAVNVLVLVFSDSIFSLLFALVPLAAMFGYKLFNGKTNKASVALVILLSVLAIPLMVYLSAAVAIFQEYGQYGITAGDALQAAATVVVTPEFLSEISGTLGTMVLFMILGLFFAWRYLTGQLNSTQTASSRLELDTMRPNPARREYEVPAADRGIDRG